MKFFFILFFIFLFDKSYTSFIYLADKLIQEEIAIGSLIADLNEELLASLSLNPESLDNSNEQQHFTFLDDIKTSTENTYFILDSITGRVTSKRYLDRESMCLNKHCSNNCDQIGSNYTQNCVMNIKVLVIPSYNIVSLNIIVQDINDNKPMFRLDFVQESIAENVPVGFKIALDLANDPDVGPNSIQSYTLMQNNTPFDLVYDSQLYLIVNKNLDRESTSKYNLTIQACDGGVPTNCGQLKLIILITDINDNNPVFEKDLYTFQIAENEPINSAIGTIKAHDLDEGLNSKIKYTLLNNYDYFNLDHDTGLLTIKKSIDYEKEQFFSLNIEAKDLGIGSLPVYTNVEISILDLNDNMPEISVSFLDSFYRNTSENSLNLYLKENFEEYKFLAHVSITDRDLNDMNKLEWKVYLNEQELKLPSVFEKDYKNNSLLEINKLNANSFTINSGVLKLDREQHKCVNISILASDRINLAYYNFSIILLDENDNRPEFDKQFYELNINENNYVDQLIHKFNALDLDESENGQVIYSVESLDGYNKIDYVYVEPLTGFLRASKVFDREMQSSYEFKIVARDNAKEASQRKFNKINCRLNIIDLNDNKPVILYQNSLTFIDQTKSNTSLLILNLDENFPLQTKLISFKCSDLDILNQNLKLSLSNNNQEDYFELKHGDLVIRSELDREQVDSYKLKLYCSDSMFNSSLDLIINIKDVNDNCAQNELQIDKKRKFFNKHNLTSLNLFEAEYFDNDLELNSKLNFKLLNHLNVFKLIVNETYDRLLSKFKYNLKINLINNQSNLSLGKYVIKLNIADYGKPSCVLNDYYTILIGDSQLNNESLLTKMLIDKNENFINDNYESFSNLTSINSSLLVNNNNNNNKSFLVYKFKKNDFFILIGLITSLILIGSILSLIGLIFFFKNLKRSKSKSKSKRIDLIQVRNYRQVELNTSTETTTLNQNEESESNLNRLSLSFKSNSDQSHTMDSLINSTKDEEDFYQQQQQQSSKVYLSSFPQRAHKLNKTCQSSKSTGISTLTEDLIIMPKQTSSVLSSSASSDVSDNDYSRIKINYKEHEDDDHTETDCLYVQNDGYFNLNIKSDQLRFNYKNSYLRSSAV